MMQLSEITLQVCQAARRAGAFIAAEAKQFSSDRIEYKGLNDLVSYVDRTAEEMLVNDLEKILPGAGFITEENTASAYSDEYSWIIDPLDGTTNFIHGIPAFAVSIALQYRGELVSGVVYEVNRDECFYATKGEGANMNGASIRVTTVATLQRSLLATGFPYTMFEQTEVYLKTLRYFMEHTHGLRRIGSAAVDLAYVACGRFEGFFEYNLNAWDVAAGALIVQEAGGTVSDFKGGNAYVFGREIIASNTLIHAEMERVIRSSFR